MGQAGPGGGDSDPWRARGGNHDGDQ